MKLMRVFRTFSTFAFVQLAKSHWVYSLVLQVDSAEGRTVTVTKNVLPCTLDNATKELIQLIFSNDMFKEAMECMNLGGCVSVNQPFNTNKVI